MNNYSNKRAFSFVEIIVALTVSIVFFGGLIYFASSTRVETSKAGNYLRALQLAQETIELIQSAPHSDLTQARLQLFDGSIINAHTGNSIKIPVHSASSWQPATKKYPEQYNNAWFYRKVRIEPAGSTSTSRFLRKISVDIYWNEGKKPDKIDSIGAEPDRMRKLSLATLIFDESEHY
jgi:type II secretory pathway pseudopilin PulG